MGHVSVNSVLTKIKGLMNSILDSFWSYIKSLITYNSKTRTISISTGLIATAINAVIALIVRKAIVETIKLGMRAVLKIEKVRNTFIEGLFTLLLAKNGVGKALFTGIMWTGFSIAGVSGAISTSISGIVDGYLSNLLSFKNTFLRCGSSLISAFSSIGGTIALFMDVADGKWDDRFSIKIPKYSI